MSDEAAWKSLFDQWDLDGNGTVRLAELFEWFKQNKSMNHDQVKDFLCKIWPQMDLDGDNKLSWEEFKEAMKQA
ncbi:hypothetical protein LSH36_21g09037 [Paralvinella palmiformis]|uniref:EF-hand domain-containing protein n=1 Tax=Paralvinella palmiformis TaxID=53620 RepID=A0AAD9KBF6_9ANNE|nr:hypothetical protein LSH36_21g09037 [Paralvinella palmiformis]